MVNYDAAGWSRLRDALRAQDPGLSAQDRTGLVFDAYTLANAGHISVRDALNLSKFLSNETSYDVWSSALSELSALDLLLRDQAGYPSFQSFVNGLLQPVLTTIGLNSTGSVRERELRGLLVYWAARWALPSVQSWASALFLDWRTHPSQIEYEVPSDVRSGVYKVGVSQGAQTEFDFMFGQYKNATVSSEQRRCMVPPDFPVSVARSWLLGSIFALCKRRLRWLIPANRICSRISCLSLLIQVSPLFVLSFFQSSVLTSLFGL